MFGLLLLVGLVVVASVGLFVFGAGGIASTQADAETDRAETTFAEFSSQVDTVARSSTDARAMNFDLGDGQAIRKERSGHVTVTVSGESDPLVDQSMTSIEYENDGETVVYQAGAVWRVSVGEPRLISAPNVNYVHGALTLPILNITGDDQLGGDDLLIESGERKTPLDDVSAVQGNLVTVEIRSEYYRGWAEYFRQRTTDAAVTVDHDANTVQVLLGQPELDGSYEDAVVAQGSVQTTSGNACIDGNVTASGTVSGNDCRGKGKGDPLDGGGEDVSVRPIDEAIDLAVDLAEEDGETLPGSHVVNGTYYVDGDLHLDGTDLTLDVASGDVTIVVDGHVALDNQAIDVVGTDITDNTASIYATGDVAIAGGKSDVTVDSGEAGGFQLYGTSEMHFALGQGSFMGTVYAPRDRPANGTNEAVEAYGLDSAVQCSDVDGEEPDVCIGQGSSGLTGAVTAGPISVEQKGGLIHDPSLDGVEPTLALDGVVMPPELTYLHVTVYDVAVSDR